MPSPPARTVMRTLSWARARPWSYLHGYARIFTAMVMRISARPWRKPIRRDQRTAQQIPNQPCLTNTLNLRYSPADQSSIQPTQNAWGAWRQRRRRRCDVCDVRGAAPVLVRPEGRTGSRARWPDDMAHLKVGWCVSMTAGLKAGNCVCDYTLYPTCLPTSGYGRSSIEYGR